MRLKCPECTSQYRVMEASSATGWRLNRSLGNRSGDSLAHVRAKLIRQVSFPERMCKPPRLPQG
ncbi:MJ0042-type zinc finger domain-containing protein [Beijerinckia mobilis]|uniref:MJ0042-type zinc finger domain-containing protein n=1 Tax=Beijerinckia mobilis TaxID=231434 RepID=UPI00351F96EE